MTQRAGKVNQPEELEEVLKTAKFTEFKASYLKDKRWYIKDDKGCEIAFINKSKVVFDLKEIEKRENVSYEQDDKFTFTFNLDPNGKLYEVLGTQLPEIVKDFVIKNKSKFGVFDDDVEDDELEEKIKNPTSQQKSFDPIMTVRLQQIPKQRIKYDNMVSVQSVDENGNVSSKYIKSANDLYDFESKTPKLLTRGTLFESILVLNYLSINEDAIRINFKVCKVKIVGFSNEMKINYMSQIDDVESLVLLEPKKMKHGGQKIFPNFNGSICGIDFNCEDGFTPAPYEIKSEMSEDGKPFYSTSINLAKDSDWFKFFSSVDDKSKSIIFENCKTWLGSKKPNKKTIDKNYNCFVKYSSKDTEKENPRVTFFFERYGGKTQNSDQINESDEKFNFKFLDDQGLEIDPETFPTYHMEHLGTTYNFKVQFKHIFIKGSQSSAKMSPKLIVKEIRIVNKSSSVVEYDFEGDNVVTSVDEVQDGNEESNEEVENSSSDEETDDDGSGNESDTDSE